MRDVLNPAMTRRDVKLGGLTDIAEDFLGSRSRTSFIGTAR